MLLTRYSRIVFSLLCCVTCQLSAESRFSTRIDDMHIDTIVSDKQIDSSPPWSKDADNPPVSARVAINKGKSVITTLEQLNTLKGVTFKFAGARLLVLARDRWAWLVEFQPFINLSACDQPVVVVILMDGTVVQPTVSNEP